MMTSNLESLVQKHLFDLLFLVKAQMRDVVKDADKDLSAMQIFILRILVEEGKISQVKLVQKMGRNKSQVTRLVHELEKKGLIIKERNEKDGRSFVLKAIPDVKNKVSLFIQHEKDIVSNMLSGIPSSDIIGLNVLLIKMKENLENVKNT